MSMSEAQAPTRAGVSSDDARTREGRQRCRAHRGVGYRCSLFFIVVRSQGVLVPVMQLGVPCPHNPPHIL